MNVHYISKDNNELCIGGEDRCHGTLRADGPQKQVLENNMDLNSLQPLFAILLGMSLVSFLYSEFLLKMH